MRIKIAGHLFALNGLWIVLTLTAFAILINLSWWQYSRAQQKELQLQRLEQLQQAGALSPAGLAGLQTDDVDGVLLSGDAHWLKPYIWLLDNQIVEGKVGYDVIVPVKAAGLLQPLLVNLGWVEGMPQRQDLPQIALPEQLQLNGIIRTKVDGLILLGQNIEDHGSWPVRLQQIDYATMGKQTGLALFPALLYQQNDVYYRSHYKSVVLPPEKHRGYALQWFLLAIAVLGVALAASHQGSAHHEQA